MAHNNSPGTLGSRPEQAERAFENAKVAQNAAAEHRPLPPTTKANRFAAASRVFEAARYMTDGSDGYAAFDGYAVAITEDGVEKGPFLVPIYQLGPYEALVAKMERELPSVGKRSKEEKRYFMDKYKYYKGLRDALKGA